MRVALWFLALFALAVAVLQALAGARAADHRGLSAEALAGADALVICTEWKAFRTVDFAWLKEMLNSDVIVDGRNLYDPAWVRSAGFEYFPIGR